MKIAFLGPAYPLRGGIAQFIALLAEELKKKNHVKIFSFRKQYPKLFFPGKDQFEKDENTLDLEIQPVLTPYNPFTWLSAAIKIKTWKPDVLILKYWIPFFAPSFGFVILFLKIFSKIKVVYLIDNIEFHEKWFCSKILTHITLGRADELITLSNSVYKDARKLFPNKMITKGFHPTYNCYDLDKFDNNSAKRKLGLTGKKVILFFGYIKQYKGLDLLLEAFPMVTKKISEAHLLIVGEVYGNDQIYYELIKKYKLEEKVTFLNKFVSNNEVEIYFKAADVLALPYKQATQSGVVQIAYDMELGAVATPVGGLPEMVIHNKTGIVAESVLPEDYAKAILDFFELDKEKIKQNIEKENKKYSWESFAELI